MNERFSKAETKQKEVTVDRVPVIGDPLEIDSDIYLIGDINSQVNDGGLR